MDAEQALALLAPKVGSLDAISGATNWLDKVTQADAALAMAGLSGPAYVMGLYKYAGIDGERRKLDHLAYMLAIDCAKDNKWLIPVGQEWVRKLSRLALSEVLRGANCEACGGRGEIVHWHIDGDKLVIDSKERCAVCGGGGKRGLALEEFTDMAAEIKIKPARLWFDRYCWLVMQYHGWEIECLSHVWRRVNGNA